MPMLKLLPSGSRFEIEPYRAYAKHNRWLEIMRDNPISPKVKRFRWLHVQALHSLHHQKGNRCD